MKKIAVFLGTRPEAIKMAPVIEALERSHELSPIVISTGQHGEMLRQVIDLFGIDLDLDLQLMLPNQTLASLTARLMTGIDGAIRRIEPDGALVQGDTTTTFVAALACFYLHVPVGHVEAGLRTGNVHAPFPEEVNRRLATIVTSHHFAPTELARRNLLSDGVPDSRITVTGNTVVDALLMEVERQRDPGITATVRDRLAGPLGAGWYERPYLLVTGHRRESFGEGFRRICGALLELARRFPAHRIVYAVHLNPNVQRPVYELLGSCPNVVLLPPLDYRDFVALLRHCVLVLTDSGGLQEEAPSLAKPVIVMRDTTERPEGVHAGTSRLVGTDPDRIVAAVSELLEDPAAYGRMAAVANPYGDGNAAARIVDLLERAGRGDGFLSEA